LKVCWWLCKSSICVLFPNACIWRCVCVTKCNESGGIHCQLHCVNIHSIASFGVPLTFIVFNFSCHLPPYVFTHLHFIELKAKTIVGFLSL
jgi:hypothetical protein